MNSLRSARISELTAAIHELDRSIATHRTAAPGYDATPEVRDAWIARGRALRAERHLQQTLRAHEIAKEAASC